MQSHDEQSRQYFIIGNLLLAGALLMLFFFGPLWEKIGVMALVVWMGMAAGGIYLVLKDKRNDNPPPL